MHRGLKGDWCAQSIVAWIKALVRGLNKKCKRNKNKFHFDNCYRIMFPLKSNKNILNFLIAYDMNIITNQKHASELMS